MPCAAPQSASPASTAPDCAIAASRPPAQLARPEARVEPDSRCAISRCSWGRRCAAGTATAVSRRCCRHSGVDPGGAVADARSGTNYHADPGAAPPEFVEQAGHGERRRHDHGKIGRRRQLRQAAQDRAALDLAALGIHEVNVTLEAAGQQVACHRTADRFEAGTGADGDDPTWARSSPIEVAGGHGPRRTPDRSSTQDPKR